MNLTACLPSTVLLLTLATLCSAANAVPAGRVLVAVGEVSALRGGVSVKLAKDSAIESGDTVVTGVTSNAQLRFTDGSIVALRPETEFRIEGYSFSVTETAREERGFFSLLKGGLRTVTGLIGKRDRENYLMKTPTATVGIRGTHYNLVMCQQNCRNGDGTLARDGLYGSVLDGAVAIKNQAQERVFGKDETFLVPDANTPPAKLLAPPSFLRDRLDGQKRSQGQQKSEETQQKNEQKQQAGSDKGSEAPPPAPKPEAPVAVPTPPIQLAQDELKNTVDEAAAVTSNPDSNYPVSGGTLAALTVNSQPGASSGEIWYASQRLLPVSFDAEGLRKIANWCSGCPTEHVERITATIREAGADSGMVAWGRWAGGTLDFGGWGRLTYGADQGVHFVVGTQTTTLPTANQTVRYTLIGATAPTNNTNSLLTTGAVTASGYLDVNFATRAISTQFDVASGNAGFRITGSTANFTSADFNLNGTTTRTSGTAALCTSGCATTIYGSFFGTQATHAGTVYRATDATNGLVEGAAVFKK